MYFENLPKIFFDDRYVTDILASVRLKHNSLTNDYMLFDEYNVYDGDTPEMVAHKYYGSTEYWWVVCIVNNIFSIHDWPKSSAVLNKIIDAKYGDTAHDVAYYVRDGSIVNKKVRTHFEVDGQTITHHETQDDLGAAVYDMIASRGDRITWFEFEHIVNDSKKNIKLLSNEYLDDFVLEYKRVMNNG